MLVPAGADAHLDAAAGDDVDRRGDLGQVGRVAVAHAGAHLAEPDAAGRRAANAAISVHASCVASSRRHAAPCGSGRRPRSTPSRRPASARWASPAMVPHCCVGLDADEVHAASPGERRVRSACPTSAPGADAPPRCPSPRILPRDPGHFPAALPPRFSGSFRGAPGRRRLGCRGVPPYLGHRHRLPRRRPRGLHGRARPRRRRRRRRRGQGRRRSPPARRRSSSPAWTSCWPGRCATGRLRVHHRLRRGRRGATCTSSASAPRSGAGEYAADLTYVDAAVDALAPHLRRRRAGRRASPPCRSAPPPGCAERLQRARPAGAEVAWPGTPSSCARASPSRTPCARTGSSTASPGRPPRPTPPLLDEVYAAPLAAGTPRLVTDFATAELVKVAANAFLATKISFINAMAEVCEAAGADVVAARRRDRPRRPDRAQVPQRRPRLRRRLPAQGHPRVHGPRRRARRRPGADVPARGRRDQPAPPRPHGRPGPRGVRRLARSASASPSSVPRSSRTATTSATPPPSTSPRQIQLQGAHGHRARPARRCDNARRVCPDLTYADGDRGRLPRRRRRAAPDRVGGVPRDRPRRARRRRRAQAPSSTAATRSTPQRWRAAGWTYRALGRPSS